MNSLETFVTLAALFAGPLIFAPLEHNLEPFCFALGMIAVTLSRQWEWHLLRKAVLDPMPITITVIAAGILVKRTSSGARPELRCDMPPASAPAAREFRSSADRAALERYHCGSCSANAG
jgi:hypothetical protein